MVNRARAKKTAATIKAEKFAKRLPESIG